MIRLLTFLSFFIFALGSSALAQQDNVYPNGASRNKIPEPLPLPDFPYVDGEILYQKVYEFDSDQTTLYGIALKYVSDYYKSAKAVIDVTDTATGLIIVKGNFNYASDFYYQFFGTNKDVTIYTTGHSMKLEVKDNKLRVSINNLVTLEGQAAGVYLDTSVDRLIELYLEYEQLHKPKNRDKIQQVNRSELLKDLHLYAAGFILELPTYFESQLNDDW